MSVAELINPQARSLMVARIAAEHGPEHAEKALDAAVAFLLDAAQSARPLSPSPLADIGWHEFILHTRAYAEFCERVAGGFIHHEPLEAGSCDNGVSCESNCRGHAVATCEAHECRSFTPAGGSCGATEETGRDKS